MLWTPPGWAQEVQGTHVMACYAQTFTGADLTQPADFAPPILDGQVTIDRTAAVRRALDVTLADDDQRYSGGDGLPPITPTAAGATYSPYGSVMQVFRGVQVPGYVNTTFGGSVFYVPLGMFRLSRAEPGADGQVRLRGYDFARIIQRNRFTVPYIVPTGTNYVTAITTLGADRMPAGLWRVGQVPETAEVSPQLVFEADSDPWEKMQQMAAAVGCEPVFDGSGYFVLRAIPDPDDLPIVAEYVEGGTALIEGAKPMDDEHAYNGVVMVAEATTLPAPLRSELWDDNPNSPTYRLGPYGQVPRPAQTTPYAANQTQLDAIAQKELLDVLNSGEPVQFTALPNPAHEDWDVVRVARARGGVEDGAYLVDHLVMPLRHSALMQVTGRRRRTAA